MKKIAAASVALVAVAGAGLSSAAVTSSTAAPERVTVTSHYVLKEVASKQLGRNAFAGSDRIRSRATGKVVGFDSFTGTFNRQTETVRIWVGIALKGGVLNGRVSAQGDDEEFTGRITGGTGKYKGADGTITGRSGTRGRTFVTLTYTY